MNSLALAHKKEAEHLWALFRQIEHSDPERAQDVKSLAFESARTAETCTMKRLPVRRAIEEQKK